MKTGMQKMHNSLELIEAKIEAGKTDKPRNWYCSSLASKQSATCFFFRQFFGSFLALLCAVQLWCGVLFFLRSTLSSKFEILAFALSEVRFPACCMEAVGVSEGESRHVACQPHSVVNYGTPRVFKEGRGCAVKIPRSFCSWTENNICDPKHSFTDHQSLAARKCGKMKDLLDGIGMGKRTTTCFDWNQWRREQNMNFFREKREHWLNPGTLQFVLTCGCGNQSWQEAMIHFQTWLF